MSAEVSNAVFKTKIRTQKDIDRLNVHIKEELDVDLEKYRDEQTLDKLADMLILPIYVVKWAIRPILAAITLFIAGFFVIPLAYGDFVFYPIFGLILFLVNGILFSVLFLTRKAKTDIKAIVDYALDILNRIVGDVDNISHKVKGQKKGQVIGLLFKGVLFVIILPAVVGRIASRIPVVGSLLKWFIKKVLLLVAGQLKFDERMEHELNLEENEKSRFEDVFNKVVSGIRITIDKTLSIIFGIARTPFLIAFTVTFLLLLLFLWLMW